MHQFDAGARAVRLVRSPFASGRINAITPPAAPVLYLSGRLSNTPINEMMKPALWFILLCWVPALIFVAYFPKWVLFFPHMILGTPW